MPRFIVLILPIIALWIAFRAGDQGSVSDEKSSFSSRASGERVKGTGLTLEDEDLEKERDERASFSERILGKLGAEKVAQQASVRKAGVKRKFEDSADPVAEVWAALNPQLLGQLSDDEQTLLRSYVSDLVSPSGKDPHWLCWGPDVSEAKVLAFHEAEKLTGFVQSEISLFANQFLGLGRWNRTATSGTTNRTQGLPTVVTWSIVPDGATAPGLNGQADEPSDFRAWMASIYGGSTTGPAEDEVWFTIVEAAFDAMAETSGVTMRYEPNDDGVSVTGGNVGFVGLRGDIRIAARALDGNSGTLAFAFAPDNGDMVFDSTDSTFDNTSSSSLRLFNVMAHELGHSLGLAHVCPLDRTKLLEPILTTSFRGPQFDEYQSLQRLYGDRMENVETTRNNDSTGNATPLTLSLDEELSVSRLSIDDNTDSDFFQVNVLGGQSLSIAIRPSGGAYLEGAQESNGDCSAGTVFDSDSIHDLQLDVIGPDGATVIAAANEGGRGDGEVLNQIALLDDGVHFVRVRGGTDNAAQLYEIDFLLEDLQPAARLREGETTILAESGSVKNGRFDPNETLRLGIEVNNLGSLTTGDLTAEVTASSNTTVFSTQLPTVIAADEMGLLEIVFGALGECGDRVTLEIELSDDSGVLLEISQELQMGSNSEAVPFDENFDASTDLPSDWTTSVTGVGVNWDPVSTRFESPLRAVFAEGVSDTSEAFLVSPSFELVETGGVLSFDHFYDIENRFDGAVLEVSRNAGAWTDLISDAEVIVTGGYNSSVSRRFGSAIAGQRAWSGSVTGFVETMVELPSGWAGDEIRFRWRLVHDDRDSGDGWWIDNIRMEMEVEECEEHRPLLSLDVANDILDENVPAQTAELILLSELPLVEPITVVLQASGSAGLDDLVSGLALTLPAGQERVVIPLTVSVDDLVEGVETLTLTIPDDQAGFAPGAEVSQSLTIVDRLDGFQAWYESFFPGVSADFSADSDGDGLTELAEYLLGTDPNSAASKQVLSLVQENDGSLLIPILDLPQRSDASLTVEFSDDLTLWTAVDFEESERGLVVAASAQQGDKGFMRLAFSLNE